MATLTLKQALAQFWLQITNKFVPRESGKGLSTNDYSNADKQKLNSIPTTIGTITGVTAGNGLSGGGTSGAITIAAQVDRGLSIASDKIGHSNSVTAGTASEGGSARTLAFGGTFNIPSVTYDAQGHISGKSSIKLTMPATPSASDVGAVPTSRTVNGKALSANITLAASDVGAIAAADKGAANGIASLGSDGRVPSSQLPSYVDDVLEYANKSSFPATGETGKIYISQNDNKTYRWSGSAYVEISPSLALGTTSSTAFAGDKGNAAYTHAVTNKGIAKSSGLYKITTNSEGHVTAATAVAKADITGLGIPAQDTTYSAATQSAAGLMSAADKAKLDGVAANANNYTYTLPNASSSTLGGVKVGSNITVSSGTISLSKANVVAALGYTPPTTDTNTTYSAGTGISLSGTTFSNSGVRSISTGSANGTISVNTNGSTANVAVKGLGSAAYKDASGTWDISISGLAYQALLDGDGNTISSTYLPLAGGGLTGRTYSSSTVAVDAGASFRNINIVGPTTTIEAGVTAIPTGEIWIKYE